MEGILKFFGFFSDGVGKGKLEINNSKPLGTGEYFVGFCIIACISGTFWFMTAKKLTI